MKLFIITGASKGLGHSLLELALNDNHIVISISRTKTVSHPHHFHIKHDLTNSKGLENKLDRTLSRLDMTQMKAIHLINNAAMIEPIGEIENFKIEDMEKHLKTNLLTPMFLCSWLLKNLKLTRKPIIIANISSGAALRPIVNWSQYCSTKAALKMFTECLMEDNQKRKNFRAFSFSPGVMDTDMQTNIRKHNKATFKNIDKFKQLKQKNLLLSPDKVALGLYNLFYNYKDIKQTHYDIGQIL